MVSAFNTIIEPVGPKGHFCHLNAETPAQPIKVLIGQKPFIPPEIELGDFFKEKLHGST